MSVRLPDSVSSPQDLAALILEVREYARWADHEAIKQRVHVQHESKPPEISDTAGTFVRDWLAAAEGKKADDLIRELQDLKDNSPTLTITVAAAPTTGFKSSVVKWCRDNLSPAVLVNFRFNSTLLGGMVVRSGSKVFDWSFRKQILDNRQKFPEVLRNVR